MPKLDVSDLDGRTVMSGFIQGAIVLGVAAGVDSFLYPDTQLLPGFINFLGGYVVMIGAAAAALRYSRR